MKGNIIILAIGTCGDVYPMLALAEALIKKSYSVTMLINGVHTSLISRLGIPLIEVSSKELYQSNFDNPALWTNAGVVKHAQKFQAAAIEPTFRAILELHNKSPLTAVIGAG